ncbi:hypothetical protein DPMN_057288 [Dreissena polymorpha]|uniref:Uncharacterized protein n=1 Tax=Dreissena polymorpha TaxID=45954 RepID=A0A9D4CUZ9_DREPO|nr:hypothetical protein DPMN_057288 [Dreissena polymorpha]
MAKNSRLRSIVNEISDDSDDTPVSDEEDYIDRPLQTENESRAHNPNPGVNEQVSNRERTFEAGTSDIAKKVQILKFRISGDKQLNFLIDESETPEKDCKMAHDLTLYFL